MILEVGASLLSSGASCSRIRITMRRFATAYNYTSHISIAPKSVSLTLTDEADRNLFSGMRSIAAQGVNFEILAGVSKLSWDALEKNISIDDMRSGLAKVYAKPHFNRWIILLTVSIAGSAFCFSFGGNYQEMLIVFAATFCGLWTRQEALIRKFNPYISIYAGSLVASLFVGCFNKAGINIQLDHAFATSVLFLIPGVPLINSFTDMVDGNILSGLVRGVNALIITMAIAFGLLTTIFIFQLI